MSAHITLGLPAAVAVFVLSSAGWLPAAHAVNPVVRYASPDGSGLVCTANDPCSILTAINFATGPATVLLAAGNYGTVASPLTTEITDNGNSIAVRGIAGPNRPVIHTSAVNGLYFHGTSSLRDLEIDSTGAGTAVLIENASESVDHVIVRDSGANGTACGAYGKLTDSLCIETGLNGVAAGTETSGGENYLGQFFATLRGDTLIANGGGTATGLHYSADGSIVSKISVTNCIIKGSSADVVATSLDSTSPVTIALNHSDYRNASASTNASVTKAGTNHNTEATPTFAAAAAGNFHETATSPTLDRGASDAAGDTDLDGNPRTLGTAPDIGAYELPEKPTFGAITTSAVRHHKATVSVHVNDEGLAATVALKVVPGSHTITPPVWSVSPSNSPITVKIAVSGLNPKLKYTLSATASNTAGTGHTTSTLAPPYRGVTITGGNATLHGHALPVEVSCPGSTIGRCTGTLTLTAKGLGAVGKHSIAITRGKHTTVDVTLDHAARKRLERAGTLRLTSTAVTHDSLKTSTTTHRAITAKA